MLFAVNVTAVIPATPANVGVFQAACVAVLVGAYHVSTPDAIAYGIVLQAVEVATALLMGLPALLNEGLSWRDVRLRTMHAAPVRLGRCPAGLGDATGTVASGAEASRRQASGRERRSGSDDGRRLGLHAALRATARSTPAGAPTSSGVWSATGPAAPAATRPAACRSSSSARRDGRPQRGDARGGAHQARSTARGKLALIAERAASRLARTGSAGVGARLRHDGGAWPTRPPARSVKIGEDERTGWSSDRPRRDGAPPRPADLTVHCRVLAPADRLRYSPGQPAGGRLRLGAPSATASSSA